MADDTDRRGAIKDFLTTRRARLTPQQVGLPTSGRRRVPGLRREEVAVLAGVSTDWYVRLEKGHIGGVSDEVLEAVAGALQLDPDERTYLFDLARTARPRRRASPRPAGLVVPAQVQWLLDSMTLSSSFVRNGRTDIVAANALARALLRPVFESPTVDRRGCANVARYIFLDAGSRDFFPDWESAGITAAALLRGEAGREPDDPTLRELIGELSTLSTDFRRYWALHEVRIRHDGVKRLRHPDVGDLELAFQSLDLPLQGRVDHNLTVYTAEPGTTSAEGLALLASLYAVSS